MKSVQKTIIIVGAGPSGIAAALRLKKAGVQDILVLDRTDRVGGIPQKYTDQGKPTFVLWSKGRILHGKDYAELLSDKLSKANVENRLETTVLRFSPEDKELVAVSAQHGQCRFKARAVLFACGAREKTNVERGRIYGQRPARVYQTLHLLELMNHPRQMPPARYGLLGSETISYSLAEKLVSTGGTPLVLDFEKKAACSLFSRFYFFRKWCPRRIPSVQELGIHGSQGLFKIQTRGTPPETIPADYLVLTGNLIPNTELLATADIPFKADSRQILPEAVKILENQGIFITGNMSGTAFGGERAYLNGLQTASKMVNFLKK